MFKLVRKSTQMKIISFSLVLLFMFSPCSVVSGSEVNALPQEPQRVNLAPALELYNNTLADMFMLHEGMKRASGKVAKQISLDDKKKIEAWIKQGIFKILPAGETIEGQDENVIGYSEGLLFSDEEKGLINKKGIFIYDVDKTLAKRDRALLEQTIQTIERLMRNGHMVVIITGQPIDIQRERIVTPIDAGLRRNLVVITNEGTVAHHFLPGGEEYLVMNDFTNQFTFTAQQAQVMENMFDGFMDENGFEYADGGEFDPREMAQAAIKLEATLETRERYARELEDKLKANGVEGFRGWASGSTTISFLHKKANKRDAGLGFLKNEGFFMDKAVYHGDEFFYNGNDAFILGDSDIYVAVVGRLESKPFTIMIDGKPQEISLQDRGRTLYLGGGPYATTHFADDFLNEKRKQRGKGNFHAIIAEVATKNTNIEAIVAQIEKEYKNPHDMLSALLESWIIENTWLHETLQEILAETQPQQAMPALDRLDIEKLRDLKIICEEYRVGPKTISLLYAQMFGANIQADYKELVEIMNSELQGETPVKYDVGLNAYKLRNALVEFSDLIAVLVGEDIGGGVKDSVEKLTGQDQVFRYSEERREYALSAVKGKINDSVKALNMFFDDQGLFSWLLAAFGNKLSVFHQNYEFEQLYAPVEDVLNEIASDTAEEISQGLVGLSGGGGAQIMSEIMLKAEVHRLLLPIAKTMPFIMIVPSEDDGGSTAIILYDGKKEHRFIFPAMGDSMNAYAGLSRGELNSFGDPKFPYFYDVTRTRFSLEGNDSLMLEFGQLAFEQMQGLMYKRAPMEQRKKVIEFFKSLHVVLKEFDLMPIEGQSMGNMMWLATADRKAQIKSKHKPREMRKLGDDQLVEVQKYLAKIYGLGNMMVLPSNLSPGTLYATLDKIVVQEGKHSPELLENKGRFRNKKIAAAGKTFQISESPAQIIDKDQGHTFVDYDIEEGAELIISHQNKEIPLGGKMMFRVRILKENGDIKAQFNIGSEAWGEVHDLQAEPEIIGIPNDTIRSKTPNQQKWGARVSTINNGRTLRVYLDRVGAGTTFRFNDDKDNPIMFKGRIVVKQTNITESYHLSKIVKVGFVGEKKPVAVEYILKVLRNSQVGCVIGPGSVVTSLLPILLIDEIREELRAMAERGLPVTFMMNPVKDNETAYETITSLMQMMEDSCGEPIFGIDRGGFVTDMFVNDSRNLPEYVRNLTDLTDSQTTRLREAERPRGILYFQEKEKEQIQKKMGDNFGIHVADVLTVINKEVRGGAPEKGTGYEPALVGQVLERIILARMRESVEDMDLYKDALKIFDNQKDKLDAAMTYLRREEKIWSEVNALQRIISAYRSKGQFTKEYIKQITPKVIVLNLSHNILEPEYLRNPAKGDPFSIDMRDAMIRYLEAGGKIIISTGLPFEVVRAHLLGGKSRIPEALIDNIYTVTLSGSQTHKGNKLIEEEGTLISLEALGIIQRVADIYGLPEHKVLMNFGSFVSLRLYDYSGLTVEEVEKINERVNKLEAEDRNFFKIQWMAGAFADKYDLRDIVSRNLQRLFEEAGIDWKVESQGVSSIDISHVSEVETIEKLLNTELKDIDHGHTLFAYAGKGLSEIAKRIPSASYLAIPVRDARSLFMQDAMIVALNGATATWDRDMCLKLFIEASKALADEQGVSAGLYDAQPQKTTSDFLESAI